MSIATIPNLTENVARQLGYFGAICRTDAEQQELHDTLRDVARGGAGCGWVGFSYYRDTSKFYAENVEAIWDLLNDDADDMGVSPLQLIASFTKSYQVTDQATLEALLALYALESVANHVVGELN